MRLVRGVAVVVFAVAVSGCLDTGPGLSDPPAPDACAGAATTPEGRTIPLRDPYWTKTTDQRLVEDASTRLSRVPSVKASLGTSALATVPTEFTESGVDYMDRNVTCRLPAEKSAHDGNRIGVDGGATSKDLRLAFLFRHPDGRESATGPSWQATGRYLNQTFQGIPLGTYDAFATAHFQDGSARTERFVLRFE